MLGDFGINSIPDQRLTLLENINPFTSDLRFYRRESRIDKRSSSSCQKSNGSILVLLKCPESNKKVESWTRAGVWGGSPSARKRAQSALAGVRGQSPREIFGFFTGRNFKIAF